MLCIKVHLLFTHEPSLSSPFLSAPCPYVATDDGVVSPPCLPSAFTSFGLAHLSSLALRGSVPAPSRPCLHLHPDALSVLLPPLSPFSVPQLFPCFFLSFLLPHLFSMIHSGLILFLFNFKSHNIFRVQSYAAAIPVGYLRDASL